MSTSTAWFRGLVGLLAVVSTATCVSDASDNAAEDPPVVIIPGESGSGRLHVVPPVRETLLDASAAPASAEAAEQPLSNRAKELWHQSDTAARSAKASGKSKKSQSATAAKRRKKSRMKKPSDTRAQPTAAKEQPSDLPVVVPQPNRWPTYTQVYSSIPFSRAEYRANPGYRHQSTIELMLGQIRPMNIYQTAPVSTFGFDTPYRYWRGGVGMTYNFYYPRPTVYRHY